MHAALDLCFKFPNELKDWNINSNSIIVLAAKNEEELYNFGKELERKNIPHSKFFEPDVGYELTSIAIVPDDNIKKLCSRFPLAGKKNVKNNVCCIQDVLELKWDVVSKMIECEQTSGLSILDHGLSVWEALESLVKILENKETKGNFPIPEWLLNDSKEFLKAYNQLGEYTLRKYTIMHDLGKPFVRTVDDEGKVHFPNHAIESMKLWDRISYNSASDKIISQLIKEDMDIHNLRPFDAIEFKNTHPYWRVQLLVGLSELVANSKMFGRTESTSFKIKYKYLDKCGKKMIVDNAQEGC